VHEDDSFERYFAEYLAEQVLLAKEDLLQKIGEVDRLWRRNGLDLANMFSDCTKLLACITESSTDVQAELRNCLALRDQLGSIETECRPWNTLRRCLEVLPKELAELLLQKASSLCKV
jgi:hypothetical protein